MIKIKERIAADFEKIFNRKKTAFDDAILSDRWLDFFIDFFPDSALNSLNALTTYLNTAHAMRCVLKLEKQL